MDTMSPGELQNYVTFLEDWLADMMEDEQSIKREDAISIIHNCWRDTYGSALR